MRSRSSSTNNFQANVILRKIGNFVVGGGGGGGEVREMEEVEEEDAVTVAVLTIRGERAEEYEEIALSLEVLLISDCVSSDCLSSASVGIARTKIMATADSPAATVKTIYTNVSPPHRCSREDAPLSKTSKPT